jgi:RimJ/RimL family protein N-acetyltransferase
VEFIERTAAVDLGTPGAWSELGLRLRSSTTDERPGPLVGDAGVHFPADTPHQVEVGITLAPAHQGEGLATEALMAVLDHLFREGGVHRVFGSVDPRNAPSIALLERLGMRKEAHFRESRYLDVTWVDDAVFAMLEHEWRDRASKDRA